MSVHLQRISVRFDYPVYFSRDVFAPSNHDLANAIARREVTRRYGGETAKNAPAAVAALQTVLAQADSGVRVKNVLNAFEKQNSLDTSAPPFAVLNDERSLETLPRRDKIAGIAEAVKVALIRDAVFFDWITEQALELAGCERDALTKLIRRTAQLHLEHIATPLHDRSVTQELQLRFREARVKRVA